MTRDEETKRKIDALVRILEGQAMLLGDELKHAIHWDAPKDAEFAVNSIERTIGKIRLNLGLQREKLSDK